MTVILIFFGITLVCAAGMLGYIIFECFQIVEEISKQDPKTMFMEEYHKIKNAREQYGNEI